MKSDTVANQKCVTVVEYIIYIIVFIYFVLTFECLFSSYSCYWARRSVINSKGVSKAKAAAL